MDTHETHKTNWRQCFRYSLAMFPAAVIVTSILDFVTPNYEPSIIIAGFVLVITALIIATVFAFRHKREISKEELYWISGFCALWTCIANVFMIIAMNNDGDQKIGFWIAVIMIALASAASFGLFILIFNKNTKWIYRRILRPKITLKQNANTESTSLSDIATSTQTELEKWLYRIEMQQYADLFQSQGHTLQSVLVMNFREIFDITGNQADSKRMINEILKTITNPDQNKYVGD